MGATAIVNGGQQLHYVDHGGTGSVVVLLHGFLMDGSMFAPQVRELGDDFRFITVDERGHGKTPADAPFDYWDVARDVLGLLDELGIDRAAVVGTSQGGFIGIRMALTAPERITALAVLGTSAAAEDASVTAQYRQLSQSWVTNGPVDGLVDMVAAICLGDLPAQDWKAQWRTISGERFARVLSTLVRRDGVLDRLGQLRCPVLVLHGSADAVYPVCRGAEIVEGAPKSEPLVVVSGRAHFLSLTDADTVNPHLRKFLAS